MALQWTEKLAVGHELIDEQHRELFKRFDDLLEACRERRGRERITELLGFLDEYVVAHFGEEEELMERYGYPETGSHKEQHASFIRKLQSLKDDLHGSGPSTSLIIRTNQVLLEWIVQHIKTCDLQFGNYLKPRLEPELRA